MKDNVKYSNEIFYETDKLDIELSALPNLIVDSNFCFNDEILIKKNLKNYKRKHRKKLIKI